MLCCSCFSLGILDTQGDLLSEGTMLTELEIVVDIESQREVYLPISLYLQRKIERFLDRSNSMKVSNEEAARISIPTIVYAWISARKA